MNKGSSKISFNMGVADSAGKSAAAPEKPRADMKTATPKAPVYATSGLMSPPPAGFVQRNIVVLAGVAIAVLTFMLGITSALLWSGGNQQAYAPQPIQMKSGAEPQQSSGVEVTTESVTRTVAPDLTDVSGNSTATTLEAAVLAGLQAQQVTRPLSQDELVRKAVEATNILGKNKLRMLREGVLAGVYTVTTVEQNGFKRVKLQTINAEMTDETANHMLLQAVNDGRIELPASMRTADGNVDVDTMMFNLVQTSLENDGSAAGVKAANEMSRKIFAASTLQSREVAGKRIYTVEPGDSLAYISLQFYGKLSAYQRILDANRETLQSSDKIQVGQRLIIPS